MFALASTCGYPPGFAQVNHVSSPTIIVMASKTLRYLWRVFGSSLVTGLAETKPTACVDLPCVCIIVAKSSLPSALWFGRGLLPNLSSQLACRKHWILWARHARAKVGHRQSDAGFQQAKTGIQWSLVLPLLWRFVYMFLTRSHLAVHPSHPEMLSLFVDGYCLYVNSKRSGPLR